MTQLGPPNTIDPSLWNYDLYVSILKFWLSDYADPGPKAVKSFEDFLKWFKRSGEVDREARRLSKPALDSIGPERFTLPPFKSVAGDRRWYSEIAAPFMSQLRNVSTENPDRARVQEETALGLCILLDQMPRNVFRDQEQAVVYTHYDRIAQAVSHEVRNFNIVPDSGSGRDGSSGYTPDKSPRLHRGFHWTLWFDMPLEHAEDLASSDLFMEKRRKLLQIAREVEDDKLGITFCENGLRSGGEHREPLELFGRYPWRNAFLGRETTAEEQKYLDENGGFNNK